MSIRLGYSAQRQVLSIHSDIPFFERTPGDWRRLGLEEKDAASLCDRSDWAGFERWAERLATEAIEVLSSATADYPSRLPTSNRIPPILFVKSTGPIDFPAGIAIVGSRKPSGYGLEVAESLARRAASRGVPVISGAAVGIDTAAHKGALREKGTTLAVVGHGLFHIYPRESTSLLEQIAEQGAVISQFPPDTPPLAPNFPARNHLIAALSNSVVVVEGTAQSGARHTAESARSLGLSLWAVPGEITRPQAILPNRLIAQGARPLVRLDDLFEEEQDAASAEWRAPHRQVELALPPRPRPSSRPAPSTDALRDLSELERGVLDDLNGGKETADELFSLRPGQIGPLNEALLNLEIKGLIRQEPGRRYVVTLRSRP